MNYLHLRFDGQSNDIPLDELDVGDLSTEDEVKQSVASYMNVPVEKLETYKLDKTEDSMTLRPNAVFG